VSEYDTYDGAAAVSDYQAYGGDAAFDDYGAYDGAAVGRLLRALDADGRRHYRAFYASGEAFASPLACAGLAWCYFARRRARVPRLWLAAAVVADLAASLAHVAMLDAFPAFPAPAGLTEASSLTEGAVGVPYAAPPRAVAVGRAASCARWAAAAGLAAAALLARPAPPDD